MSGRVTFNLIKDGIVGHVNVTITQGGFSETLGNSGDLSVFPMGIYSPSFEKSRLWASTNLVQKTLVVDDANFQAIKSYFAQMEGGSTHYGLYFGVNCIDFVQNVYELTEEQGHFADLFSIDELRGPLSGWLMRKERTLVSVEAKGISIAEASYQDNVTASFGISGGVIILAVLIGSLVYNRICARRKSVRHRANPPIAETL
jgi:hypothetical protein